MESEVQRLKVNKEGGHTHLGDEHFKKCLREAYPEKETPSPQKKYSEIDEMCGTGPVYVAAQYYTCRSGMENFDPHSQAQHIYLRDRDLVGPLEGDGGHY